MGNKKNKSKNKNKKKVTGQNPDFDNDQIGENPSEGRMQREYNKIKDI